LYYCVKIALFSNFLINDLFMGKGAFVGTNEIKHAFWEEKLIPLF
jgi:hypothetical protein